MRAPLPYDELQIRLSRGRDGGYNVLASSASGARADGTFILPFSEIELENFRLNIDPARARTRGHRTPHLERARQFGDVLFQALISDEGVREVFTTARRDAEMANRGMRLSLSLSAAPELAAIPWEFLYRRPGFFAQSVSTPLVRHLDLEHTRPPLALKPPLRILGMISSPTDEDLAQLDVEAERAKVQSALEPLIARGQVFLQWLADGTLSGLQREVDGGGDYHVFHYIGHGVYDELTGGGFLVLERPSDGRPHYVGGEQLGRLLCDRHTLRLALLNACEAATTAARDPFGGVAAALVEYEVPAVVGMQFSITDAAAITFAEAVYTAIADDQPIDAAVTAARRALSTESDVEWATPVLFMRARDGCLFDFQPSTQAAPAAFASIRPDDSRPSPSGDTQQTAPVRPVSASMPRRSNVFGAQLPGAELLRIAHPRASRWLRNEPRNIRGVAVSPDGSLVATCSVDNSARVWAIPGGREVLCVRHEDTIDDVAFSPDGTCLATSGDADHTARVWTIPDGRELLRVRGGSAVVFSPDGTSLATGDVHGETRVWALDGGRELLRLAGGDDKDMVFQVAYNSGGTALATVSTSVRVWALPDGKQMLRLPGAWPHDGSANCGVAFNPDNASVVTVDRSGARLWDLAGGRELLSFPHLMACAVALSSDGSWLAAGNKAGIVAVWALPGGRHRLQLRHKPWPHGESAAAVRLHGAAPHIRVNRLTFSPDGTFLVTGGDDGTAALWAL